MSAAVVLDSGPVGLLTNPNNARAPVAVRRWLADLIAAGRRVVLAEVVDYEVRRELIRTNKLRSLRLLDGLPPRVEYLPITTTAMRIAADLWARARNAGLPTAAPGALDGDAILAAQATALGVAIVVATENPAHLTRFVPAEFWSNIVP
jgi:predicted nucleic acid-binding protein